MLKGVYFLPLKTVHTARTIMLDEISRVMNYSGTDTDFISALNNNVSGKQTQKNLYRTNAALKKLYSLNPDFLPFKTFSYFWQIVPETDKPMLVFLFALGMDRLVYDVSELIIELQNADLITSRDLANSLLPIYHNDFTPKTIASASRNLISTYRQAGLLTGNGKNYRNIPNISAYICAFACLMAYFNGDMGEYILNSKWVRILNLSLTELRNLASEATVKGVIDFRYAGSVVTISFNNLFTILGINGI